MNSWSTVFALAAIVCLGVSAGLTVAYLRLSARVAALQASTVALPRSVTSAIASLSERLDELQPAVESLLNREKMRRVRKGAGLETQSEPDPHRDPAGWKAHMRRRQALGGSL
jgi:hypothetical protein